MVKGWMLRYAPHLGFPSANTPYFLNSAGSADIAEQIAYIAQLGFAGVADKDFTLRSRFEQTKIGEAIARHGLEMASFVDQPARPLSPWGSKDSNIIDQLRAGLEESILAARRVGARFIGIAAADLAGVSHAEQLANMVDNLRGMAAMVERTDVMLCIELISPARVSGVLIRHLAEAHDVVIAIDSPAVRILFDTLHVQYEAGEVIASFESAQEKVGLIQIGDYPNRHEPGSGEIDFVAFPRAVNALSAAGRFSRTGHTPSTGVSS